MNLKELKQAIDTIVESLPRNTTLEDISVMINLSQPSICCRASVGIKDIKMGFDWEHNQLRIDPDKPIILK
nr:hypothetical protein [Clostridioides sp.]